MKRLLTTTAVIAIMTGTSGLAIAQSNDNANQAPTQNQQTQSQSTQNQNTQNQAAGNQMDCAVVNRDFEAQLRESPDMRAGYSVTLTRDVRNLRNAAETLAAYGKDEACQQVASAINELVTNPQEARRTAMRGEPIAGWRDAPAGYDYEAAQPLSDMSGQLRADEILGSDVRSSQNENLGEISDIVFDPNGAPAYAIISYGGFLGLGQEQSAIPFEEFRVSGDGDVFYLAMSQEQLENAPRFERGNFDWMEDENWRRQNDEYFQSAQRDAG